MLFAVGRWRYDVVAVIALLTVTLAGIVPGQDAFLGFGHPAVVTVGAVLVLSRGLMNSGAVDFVASKLSYLGDRPLVQLAGLTVLVTALSAFMNNVGALALLMPVAIRMAQGSGYSPSLLLMPLAFGSLLGGLTTLIGTPPNIIVATFRQQNDDNAFAMFDFAPVGAAVAVAGVAFIVLLGWRLVPRRTTSSSVEEMFDISGYAAEVIVPADSPAIGMTVREFEAVPDGDVVVAGLVRGERRLLVPSAFEVLREGDVLLIETDSSTLEALVNELSLSLSDDDETASRLSSEDVRLIEAVILPRSILENRSAVSLSLRARYGVNLLAVSRRGSRLRDRLGRIQLTAGDVILLQGDRDRLPEIVEMLGCAPIAAREWHVGRARRLLLSVGLFGAALALTAVGILEVQVALATAAMLMVLLGILNLREAYDAIDWPILALLGAMIPVGVALETTGGADFIADQVLIVGEGVPIWVSILIVLVATMLLSDVVNNAAAAVVMAPIGLRLADQLGASADPFLMAVAIGASCAFLTPIGHQSNTLVMGPGGYRFGDYWRLGLPVELLVVAVGLPLILLVWPP